LGENIERQALGAISPVTLLRDLDNQFSHAICCLATRWLGRTTLDESTCRRANTGYPVKCKVSAIVTLRSESHGNWGFTAGFAICPMGGWKPTRRDLRDFWKTSKRGCGWVLRRVK